MTVLSVQPPYPIFTDRDGTPLEDGYIWLGTAGLSPLTNPISVYWDAALTQLAGQPIRTRGGYPANNGTPARLYVSDDCSILVQDKKGATLYSALSATERYNFVVIAGGLDASQVEYTPPFPNSVATNAEAKFAQTVSVKDFGAVGDGVTDDRAACQAAIDYAKALGGSVYFPAGNYRIFSTPGPDGKNNGLVINYTNANSTSARVRLYGDGASSVLKAGNNNMIMVRWSDSHCEMKSMSIDADGRTQVWGLGVVPEDMNQTTSLTFQLYNSFSDLFILSCEEAIALKTGPDVGGADSGCWYNNFFSIFIQFCTRGIWLMPCQPNASSVNRNYFQNIRIGQLANTGVQVDNGDTNTFSKVHIEGVLTGTSPNALPTAIKVIQTGTNGADNNNNTFIACMLEANRVSLDNANPSTELYGCELGAPVAGVINEQILTQRPRYLLGGDPSQIPQITPAFVYQSNGQLPGVPNNTIWPNASIRSSNNYFTNHQQLIAIDASATAPGGVIAAGGSHTFTIYPVPSADQQITIQFVVTCWERNLPLPTTNATNTATGTILARWESLVGNNLGLSTVTYAQSLGVGSYGALATMTVTVAFSGNNIQMTIANGTASAEYRRVRVGLVVTSS